MSMRHALFRQNGGALLEFALILPLLVACALPLFDYMRNIAAQTVLTNAAREVANLAKRPAQARSLQEIMNWVGDIAAPLDLRNPSALLITKIVGDRNCNPQGELCSGSVLQQTRWVLGAEPVSRVWNGCGVNWAQDGSGQCADLGANRAVALMQGGLYQGQIVMVAEAQFRQTPLIGALSLGFMGISIPELDPSLYAAVFF